MIYVAAYDFIKYKNEDRYGSGSTAARPLVEYLASKLVACGEQVTILSTRVNAKGMGFYKARKGQLSQGIILKLPASLGSRSRLIKFMDRVHSKIWLFLQLVFSAKRNEKVIMYHTLSNIIPVYLAKKIKGFKLVLQTNEIYSDVYQYKGMRRKIELAFINQAEEYIFATQMLQEKVNNTNKPYIVMHGNYGNAKKIDKSHQGSTINLVYAGKLESMKGIGVVLDLAKYLDEQYILHILGYGDKQVIAHLQESITKLNCMSNCKIVYDGFLHGEEYEKFLQNCDIGLCCQDPNILYNESSFPSKVLSYLENGLCVVCSDIKSVRMSPFAQYICFYTEKTPEDIARTIKIASRNIDGDICNLFVELDQAFEKELRRLIG